MIAAPPYAGNMTTNAAGAKAIRRPVERVAVTVPARLHLGFLDLNGGLGRRFGSFGITLDSPQTRLTVGWSDALAAEGPDADRALAHIEKVARHFGVSDKLRLTIERAIPSHVGLGSGTQLALATGVAVARLHDLDVKTRAIAHLLDRGSRSSIGIAAFEQGGVILDGGRGDTDEPPPVLSRFAFPEQWRILLIFDQASHGVHGPAEIEAFHRLPPFPAEDAARLCRMVLMIALPALAEEDLDRFGGAVAELQRTVGDHFAPVQGARFMSAAVADVLSWLEAQGICGVGQSSWGPTGFAIIPSEVDAETLLAAARRRWPDESNLAFQISRGRNRGGEIELVPSTD
jgi:beta-ribofuranosylaminobenzene 5'-phosphate synthase